MFGTIRKHQSWLWIIIITLVVISFVWYMGPNAGQGGPGYGGAGSYGTLNGRAITPEEFMAAYTGARIQFFLMSRSWPEDSPAAREMFRAEAQVAQRLVILEKVRELGIHVSDEAVALWIADQFRDPRTGAYSQEMYDQFMGGQLRRGSVGEAAFLDYARQEVALEELTRLAGVSGGLVSPREAEVLFRLQNEQLQTAVAAFALSNYVARVEITAEKLEAYFNEEAARYRVPEKVRVDYVHFPTTNYVTQAEQRLAAQTDVEAQLEALYLQRGTNTFRDAAGTVLSPELAQQQIRREILDQAARQAALEDATAFGEELLARIDSEPGKADHLAVLAGVRNLSAGVTEPFARFDRPPGLPVGTDFGRVAFDLTPGQPMSMEPLVGQDGFYLITLHERIEGFVPPLESIRATVEQDFQTAEARRLARESARAFAETAGEALAKGEAFEALVTSAGGAALKPPPFSPGTRSLPGLDPAIEFPALQKAAIELATGAVSGALETRDGAMVVYLESRQDVDESRMATELPGFVEELRRERRQTALQEWFQKEAELAQVQGLPSQLR